MVKDLVEAIKWKRTTLIFGNSHGDHRKVPSEW